MIFWNSDVIAFLRSYAVLLCPCLRWSSLQNHTLRVFPGPNCKFRVIPWLCTRRMHGFWTSPSHTNRALTRKYHFFQLLEVPSWYFFRKLSLFFITSVTIGFLAERRLGWLTTFCSHWRIVNIATFWRSSFVREAAAIAGSDSTSCFSILCVLGDVFLDAPEHTFLCDWQWYSSLRWQIAFLATLRS